MLKKVNKNIVSETHSLEVSPKVTLRVEILRTGRKVENRAVFLHGGGITGNSTLVRRPAAWLLENNVFDEIVLPDRRGAGGSSPFFMVTSFSELAGDIKILLDKLEITGALTLLAASYAGPIALNLAAIDSRISRVFLLASSPMLLITKGELGILHKMKLLVPVIKLILKLLTGRSQHQLDCVDLDFVYDISHPTGYIAAQVKILRQMKRSRLTSMLLQVDSVFKEENQEISKDIKIRIPVYQIIGSRDTVWQHTSPAKYSGNMKHFRQELIPNARHRDLFFRADEFLQLVQRIMAGE